ncbi:MAG: hypothetical protein HKN76_02670, partial [Saprospiraceae bacterium]|nr:hypothetical protein [Saprospiraceae bacterium]
YTVAYMGVIPVLVEAIKEQQSTIERLEMQLEDLARAGEVAAGTKSNVENRLLAIEAILLESGITIASPE